MGRWNFFCKAGHERPDSSGALWTIIRAPGAKSLEEDVTLMGGAYGRLMPGLSDEDDGSTLRLNNILYCQCLCIFNETKAIAEAMPFNNTHCQFLRGAPCVPGVGGRNAIVPCTKSTYTPTEDSRTRWLESKPSPPGSSACQIIACQGSRKQTILSRKSPIENSCVDKSSDINLHVRPVTISSDIVYLVYSARRPPWESAVSGRVCSIHTIFSGHRSA